MCVSDENAPFIHTETSRNHILVTLTVWLLLHLFLLCDCYIHPYRVKISRAYRSYQRKFYHDLVCSWIGRFCWFCYRRSQVCGSSEEFCACSHFWIHINPSEVVGNVVFWNAERSNLHPSTHDHCASLFLRSQHWHKQTHTRNHKDAFVQAHMHRFLLDFSHDLSCVTVSKGLNQIGCFLHVIDFEKSSKAWPILW